MVFERDATGSAEGSLVDLLLNFLGHMRQSGVPRICRVGSIARQDNTRDAEAIGRSEYRSNVMG